mgnify:CR=1 FL=1
MTRKALTLLRQNVPLGRAGMNGQETLRSFSEGGLRATESSAFVSGCPVRERAELHLPDEVDMGTGVSFDRFDLTETERIGRSSTGALLAE